MKTNSLERSRDKTFGTSAFISLLTDNNRENRFTLLFKSLFQTVSLFFLQRKISHHWEMFSDSTPRNSRPDVFCNKDILKNFSRFAGKHLCWSLFLILSKETPAQEFSSEYWEIFKNNVFYRTPVVAPF